LALAVHSTEVKLGLGAALFGSFAQPCHGLLGVLWQALALFIHRAEVKLRIGVTLLGQRTEYLYSRHVVVALKRSLAVFKWTCRCYAKLRKRENAADKESVGPLHHCFARLRDKKLRK
jgi:hypothetical protein